jgi:hypothetical protein
MSLPIVANAIRAACARMGTAAQVSVSPVRLAIEIGEFLLNVRKRDSVTASDGTGVLSEMFLTFFKSKIDVASVAEDVAFEFYKALHDEAGLSDARIFAFFKTLIDEMRVQDAHALNLSKPMAELVAGVEDKTYLLSKKVKEDAVGAQDALDYFDVAKALTDGIGLVEARAFGLFRPIAEKFEVADAEFQTVTKNFQDTLHVTDDMDGAASILDDQAMQFTKQMAEVAGVTDEIYIIIEVLREWFETATVGEVFALLLSRGLFDSAAVSDYCNQILNKTVFDTVGTQDSTTKSAAKSLADSGLFTDGKAIAMSRVKNESTLISDTGSLRNQSYSGSDYFAEDYVGVSRSF